MAIAFDSATVGGLTVGLSHTYSHTVGAGSGRFLFIWTLINTSDALTSVTFNSVAASLICKAQEPSGRWNYLHGLAAPDSGAHNVVCTASSTDLVLSSCASYDGCTTSTNNSATTTATSATSLTANITTLVDNSWAIAVFRADSGGIHTGTGLTSRATSGIGTFILGDGNGPVTPAGSTSLQAVHDVGPHDWVALLASIGPAGGGGGTTWPGYISPFGWH